METSTPSIQPRERVSAGDPMSPLSAPAAIPPAPGMEKITLRPTRGWRALDFREIFRFRDLLFVLAGRDLKLRYKQTFMGVTWIALQPLLAAGIFTFVFGVIAGLKAGGGAIPYFVLSFAGLIAWSGFGTTLAKVGVSMTGNAHLVSKVYFPRLILPLSNTLSVTVDLAIALALMVLMMLVFRIAPSWPLLLLPAWAGLIMLMALGLGLVAAALTVSYRDVQYLLPVMIPFLMYASPVAYQLAHVPPQYRTAYLLANPLAGLIEGFRWSLLAGAPGMDPPPWAFVAYSVAMTAVALLIGAAVFRRLERRFADVI